MRAALVSLVLASLLAPGCGPSESPLSPAAFDAARAWEDLRVLVEDIGARRMDTKGAADTRAYIREQLEPLGWEFEEVSFPVTVPEGARRKGELTATNLLARRPGTKTGDVWLASHYDTFDKPRFVGANDAGSSTAALIECGRQLAGDGPREGYGIVLVWFDGEEPFHPLPWDDDTNSTFGSRHQVAVLKEAGTLDSVKALVLMDMVGDVDLHLSIARDSTGWLMELFESVGRRLGHNQLFVDRREIKDDHRPFVRAGVPAINLIDLRYGPSNTWWHTVEDTLEHCSQESLGLAGSVVLTALPLLEAELDQR